ncbi:MAG: hypothetical protein HN531_08405 [Opitutae bacterium]|nr:hypothetical protein [Opitutae bacterium]
MTGFGVGFGVKAGSEPGAEDEGTEATGLDERGLPGETGAVGTGTR